MMSLLINPNVAYVLLVIGFLTAILALFSPGTGLLEIGALATLVLAGYGIANLPINGWAFAVMALGLLPFALTLIQPRSRRAPLILAAAVIFLIGALLLFRGSSWLPAVNPFLALFLTAITLTLIWVMATKTLEAATSRPAFDLDRLIGMVGQASTDIRGEGSVYVNGEEWSAVSKVFIPEGSAVRVLRRKGLTLEVEPDHS